METSLRVLDVRLRVECGAPALVAPFLGVFSPSLARGDAPAAKGATEVRVRVDDAAGRYDDGSRQVRLAPHPLRAAQVYNLLYTTLVRALPGVYLLHAAVVARGGKAWVVSGPAGAGKTSLARALAARGFTLMSDDLAPLAVADGRVHPFPRRIGLTPEAAAALDREDLVQVGDKAFADPAQVGAEGASGPLPPGAVAIMNPYTGGSGPAARMTVALLDDGGELARRLRAMDGVQATSSSAPPGVTCLELELAGGAAVAAVMAELDRGDAQVLFHTRHYGAVKRYAETPALTRIPVREAALDLLRETLNREPSSALMRRLGGQAGAALVELAGLLDGVPCHRLTPAGIEATADLLEEAFR